MSLGRERADDHPARRQLVDEVLGEQQAQRLAQRRAAHLQGGGELGLVEPLARLELELEDAAPQLGVDELAARGAPHAFHVVTLSLHTCIQVCFHAPSLPRTTAPKEQA